MVELRKGFERCPHCGGKTKCDCGTCGKIIESYDTWHNVKTNYRVDGVCTVCKGLGQIPERKTNK